MWGQYPPLREPQWCGRWCRICPRRLAGVWYLCKQAGSRCRGVYAFWPKTLSPPKSRFFPSHHALILLLTDTTLCTYVLRVFPPGVLFSSQVLFSTKFLLLYIFTVFSSTFLYFLPPPPSPPTAWIASTHLACPLVAGSHVASLHVASARVMCLRVASLHVASPRVTRLCVACLRVAILHVATQRVACPHVASLCVACLPVASLLAYLGY